MGQTRISVQIDRNKKPNVRRKNDSFSVCSSISVIKALKTAAVSNRFRCELFSSFFPDLDQCFSLFFHTLPFLFSLIVYYCYYFFQNDHSVLKSQQMAFRVCGFIILYVYFLFISVSFFITAFDFAKLFSYAVGNGTPSPILPKNNTHLLTEEAAWLAWKLLKKGTHLSG